ncbi:MAG: nucleotidyltransferase family protein [Candidatus Diapherotrites archaeon]|nr:nucleotidyltransferase family protein [Candidatus Diapherotrites archaeon]
MNTKHWEKMYALPLEKIPNTAIVMAAGKGTRMLPLTETIPKALVNWKGKPLIVHVLNELNKTSVQKAIIVIGYKGKQIQKYLGKKFGKIKLEYVTQTQQLGTAHAVQTGLKKIHNENFLVLSADVIASAKDLNKFLNSTGDCCMALRKTKKPERYGIIELKGKNIVKLIEKPKNYPKKTAWMNAGIYSFNANTIPFILNVQKNKQRNEFELTDVVQNLIHGKKKVIGIKFEKKVYDIGNLEDLKQK